VIAGPDEGATLDASPVIMATWREWKKLHPETSVLYAPPITVRDKAVQKMLDTMILLERLASRSKPWDIMKVGVDRRLPAMSFVFGVRIGDVACAYPLDAVREHPIINDAVGGQSIVLLYDGGLDIGEIFSREVDGTVLSFAAAGAGSAEGIVATDAETGSGWDVTGRAQEGTLAGHQLERLPHYNKLFWFSWAAFNPGTRINHGQQETAGGTRPNAAAS